jgi:hypothetical protein
MLAQAPRVPTTTVRASVASANNACLFNSLEDVGEIGYEPLTGALHSGNSTIS